MSDTQRTVSVRDLELEGPDYFEKREAARAKAWVAHQERIRYRRAGVALGLAALSALGLFVLESNKAPEPFNSPRNLKVDVYVRPGDDLYSIAGRIEGGDVNTDDLVGYWLNERIAEGHKKDPSAIQETSEVSLEIPPGIYQKHLDREAVDSVEQNG